MTNPEGGVLPEILTVVPATAGVTVLPDRFSTLSPSQPVINNAETANRWYIGFAEGCPKR